MHENGIVLAVVERDVFHAQSGLTSKTLMAATLYQQPRLQLVLTRETLTPNVTDATVSYTVINGDTLEDLRQNLDEQSLMYWKPLRAQRNGQGTN